MDIQIKDIFLANRGKFKGKLFQVVAVSPVNVIFNNPTESEKVYDVGRFYFEEMFTLYIREGKQIAEKNKFDLLSEDLFIYIKTELLNSREKNLITHEQALLFVMILRDVLKVISENRSKYGY